MTDAFAALSLPRHPLVDPEILGERYHAASRRWHPDAPGGDPARFAEIEAARAILARTPDRIAHLLALCGARPDPSHTSSDPGPLFGEMAACSAALRDLERRRAAASGPLAKALLAPETAALARRIEALLAALRDREASESRELAAIAAPWTLPPDPSALNALSNLLPRLATTARWLDAFTKYAATLRGLA